MSSTKTSNGFGQKNYKFPVCWLLENRGPEIMFDDHLLGEQAFLGYKNINFR